MGESAPKKLFAPGKLFLAGEYAVLAKGKALVIAVNHSLRAAWLPRVDDLIELVHKPSGEKVQARFSGLPQHPLRWPRQRPDGLRFAIRAVELALRFCLEQGRKARGFQLVFENDFELSFGAGADKPGLGGSAAATALAVRATAMAQERPLHPREALGLAAAAHWIEQGGAGSCGDVAASCLGGALEVKLRNSLPAPDELWNKKAIEHVQRPLVETSPLELPADLKLLAVWAGRPADSRILMSEVRRFSAGRPALFRARVEQISHCAGELKSALAAAAANKTELPREMALNQVREAAAAMAALGQDAGVRIVTPELAQICAIAASAGCAGKPSGAGGGDCALIFAFKDEALEKATAMLQKRNFKSVRIELAPGATSDIPPP